MKINWTSILIGILNVIAIVVTGVIYWYTQCKSVFWGLLLMAFFNFLMAGTIHETYTYEGDGE